MRTIVLCLVALAAEAFAAASEGASSFPLPSLDGKPLAVAPGQTKFRVPMGFDRLERFYRDQFRAMPEVTISSHRAEGTRRLVITSRRKGDVWARAVVKEGELETVVEVKPMLLLDEARVDGSATPLVIIIPRSEEAARAARDIDHTEREP